MPLAIWSRYFTWCTWYMAEDAAGQPAGLALLYRRLAPPVLLLMGETPTDGTAILDRRRCRNVST